MEVVFLVLLHRQKLKEEEAAEQEKEGGKEEKDETAEQEREGGKEEKEEEREAGKEEEEETAAEGTATTPPNSEDIICG